MSLNLFLCHLFTQDCRTWVIGPALKSSGWLCGYHVPSSLPWWVLLAEPPTQYLLVVFGWSWDAHQLDPLARWTSVYLPPFRKLAFWWDPGTGPPLWEQKIWHTVVHFFVRLHVQFFHLFWRYVFAHHTGGSKKEEQKKKKPHTTIFMPVIRSWNCLLLIF